MALPVISPDAPPVPSTSVLYGFIGVAVGFTLALFVSLGWAV